MTQLDYIAPAQPLGFTDRRTGLMVFGIILIVIGAISGLFTLMMPMALMVQSMQPAGAPRQPIGSILAGMAMYAVVALLCIACGIGSVRPRRWVRPIVLTGAWIALLTGLIGGLVAIIMLPSMMDGFGAAPPGGTGPAIPPAAARAMVIGMAVGMGAVMLIMIAIPAVFIWFYRKPDVRSTLEFFDPHERWTDACPPAVLGVSLAMLLTAGWFIVTAVGQGVLPMFGVLLSGWPARALLVLLAIPCALSAWLIYRLRWEGWWLALIILLGVTISPIITFARVELRELYIASGMGPEEIEMLESMGAMGNAWAWSAGFALLGAATIGYMIYVRKWFPPATTDSIRPTQPV